MISTRTTCWTLLTLAFLVSLNLVGVRRGLPYLLIGTILWFLFLKIGLHGILTGILLGKRLGWVETSLDLSWQHILGLGMLGSIGFTMSLFIANLSFGANADLLEIAKLSVIMTSVVGGLMGYTWLRWACPRRV